jgi:hypothetical protein
MLSEQIIPADFRDLAKLQHAEEDALLARANVVGVALGNKFIDGKDTGKKAIVALVDAKLPKDMLGDADRVPATIGKIPTDVQEVGVIQAGVSPLTMGSGLRMDELSHHPVSNREDSAGHLLRVDDASLAARENIGPFTLASRVRPAYGGVSVGHYKITAGTLGTCCYDATPFPGIPQRYYILSNNHVLANSNAANIGDPILQPGPYDGGTYPADVIAKLSRFVPIKFMQPNQAPPINYVDAAVAEGNFSDLDRRIFWVGHLRRLYQAPEVGMIVEKCGRTTNLTTGRILNINATVDVNYGNGQVARFSRQILTTSMSAGGDSGSLVADLEESAVGLLFAGSPQVTVLNPILLVQQLLGIRVTES